jgi:hypothetical protein
MEFLVLGAEIIIWLFLLRGVATVLTARNPDSSVGRALASIVH